MSDQAVEQSIEDRFQLLLEPEQEEEQTEEPQPQDNSEEPEEAEEEVTPEEEQDEPEEESEEPDLAEVEIDGKTYQLPAELKDKVMLQADYTRKTQELSEQRKQVEAEYERVQQLQNIQQQNLEGVANLLLIDKQLEQGQLIDWNALYDSDPAEFVRQKEHYRDLQGARQELSKQLSETQQYISAEQQAKLNQAQEYARKELESSLKWDGKKATDASEYIKGYIGKGITETDFAALNQGAFGPVPIIWAYKAMQFDKLQASKGDTAKKVASLPKVTKPGQSTKTVTQQQDADMRSRLKKSGSVDDAAALFLSRMKG